jgi:hypothetical protein
MLSVSTLLKGLCVLAPLVAAAPARVDARQEASSAMSAMASAASAAAAPAATAAAPGGALTDVDILNL